MDDIKMWLFICAVCFVAAFLMINSATRADIALTDWANAAVFRR